MPRKFSGARQLADWTLTGLFAFAAFIALVYEPLFFLDCGWAGLHQGTAGPCAASWVGRAWLAYLKVEPLYGDAPVFLQLVNEFDTLLFAWFYVLSLVVFLKGYQDRAWYRTLATFVSGMMVYAMAYYLTWESLTYRQTGAQLSAVFQYNGLWLFIFVFLMARLYLMGQRRSVVAAVPLESTQ